MNLFPKPALAALGLLTALTPLSQAQLLSDDFESYAADATLPTSGSPWLSVSNGLLVRDESTDTPFGSPNQYFDWNDNSSSFSPKAQSSNIGAASNAVTTFAFNFYEPSSGGGSGLIFGYAMEGLDINSSGKRVAMNLDDGAITGLSSSAGYLYSLDTPHRVYVVFNDTASPVDYLGGTLAAESADIWIDPDGGPLVFAGTRTAENDFTNSYRVGFRSFSSSQQRILIDDVSLETGAALPVVPPSLVSTSPADGDMNAPITTDPVVTFNMPVFAGTGDITVHLTSDDTTVTTLDVTDPAEVSFSGNSVTLNLPSDLALATGYYVLIPGTGIVNFLGEEFGGFSVKDDWNFETSADATPPSLTGTTPVDDATGVALDTNLVATFDENIAAGSGNITITNITAGTTFADIDITDGSQISISGSTLTIDPTADLREGRTYAVEIADTAITDTVNAFAGISDPTIWNFDTIADNSNPTLASTTPADDTTDVAFGTNLVATFDEAIQAGTGDITILNLTTAATLAPIAITDGTQVSISGNTLTIDPSTDLVPGQYAVQIAAGAITDLSGNPFAGIESPNVTSWNFTTYLLSSKDYIIGERQSGAPPSDYYPNASSNQVGTGGAGGEINHRNVVLGMTLPVLEPGQTAGSVDFEFEITGARDTTGASNLPDLHVYLLNTIDPDATGDTFFFEGPSDSSTDVELVTTTSVTISGIGENTFDDDSEDRVVTLTGDALALIQSFYGGDHIPDRPEAFFRFNLGEDTLITTYRRYRIDLAANESGIEITSVPVTPPVLLSTSPADDGTTTVGADLTATFDQPIRTGSGNIVIRDLTNGSIFATIPVTDASQVSTSGPDLIINPTLPLLAGGELAVQIDTGAVLDLTGQSYAGIVDPDTTTWSFNTSSQLPPTSKDSIRGRAQSPSASLDYLVNTSAGGGRVGIGGPGGDRQDFNQVLGFTLPTLPVGETLSGATFDFEITRSRDNGSDPGLHVYLLDTADPDSSGIEFFYHGPSDPSLDVAFVGGVNAVATGDVTYNDDEFDETLTLSGDALALLQSFYGGDHIPERTEVFFRFNLDQLLGGADISNFERYFIDSADNESSLTLTSAPVSPYGSWAASNGLSGPDAAIDADLENSGAGDDLENLLEYAFGTDPNVVDNTPLIVTDGTTFTPGTPAVELSFDPEFSITLRYVRLKDHVAAGLTYTPQFNANGAFFADPAAPVPTVVADAGGDYEVVEVPFLLFDENGMKVDAMIGAVEVTLAP